MVRIVIDGVVHRVPEGTSILRAIERAGIEIPALCHDERFAPSGACRLCVVEVGDDGRRVIACASPVGDGLVVRTRTPALESARRMYLEMMAAGYPSEALERQPDKPFHRWLRLYGVTPEPDDERLRIPPDDAHPYLHVDMSQCIRCWRCVGICDQLQGQFVWKVWNRGRDAVPVPDSGTTLRASTCVGCGACADSCPTGAIEDKTVLASGAAEAWTRTTCPYCGTGCEMNVGTRDGRIVDVRPVLDAPVSKGHLCAKGRYAFDFVEAEDRVTEPLVRVNGAWKAVSWDDAIRHVAGELRRLVRDHGPDAVGILGSARATNEDDYVAQKLARVALGTNNVDCCARVCHAPTAAALGAMLGAGAATNSYDDIEKAGALLLVGTNATENHPIVGARIKQAALRGARLVVVDPRTIELARFADVHLAPRPGTNVPLLHAMAHVLFEEGLVDDAFLRAHADGVDELRRFVVEFAPESVAPVVGVDAAAIRAAARIYARGRPSMAFHGLGVTEHSQGTEGVMCLVNLALLTGNLGKEGSGINPLRGQNNVQGAAHMGCEPRHLTGYADLATSKAAFEAAWRTELPSAPGLDLLAMMDRAAEGKLRGLYAIGYDILLTNPNAQATRAALRRLELLVVEDMFMNETAREAGTVFLPSTSSFEKDGTFMNSERRIQRVRKAIEPRGASRADWEIVCAIGRALGHEEAFAFDSPEAIWEEIRRVWPAGSGITYARLDSGGIQWPCTSEDDPGTSVLHRGGPKLGRAALRRVRFEPTSEAVSDEHPLLLTTGRSLMQFNAGTMTGRTPNVELAPEDHLDMAPADARRLGLAEGELVRVESRHGHAVLRLRIRTSQKSGEVFATFHTAAAFVNEVTGPKRDGTTATPEYKVTAVRVVRAERT